jgi:hypothetical protein
MTSQMNLLLALQQVENISNLMKDNEYEKFFASHLVSLQCEIQRQLTLKNGKKVL